MNAIAAYDEYSSYLQNHGRSRSTFEALSYGFRGVLRCVNKENSTCRLEEIQARHIDAFVSKELGRGSKPQSVNPRMSTLRKFFSWCLQRGYLKYSPMACWEALRNSDSRPRKDFTREEVEAILRAEENPIDRVRWMFYFNTGRRVMEGVNLMWEWVDLERRLITLPAEANKSRRPVRISINDTLYDVLKEHKARHGSAFNGRVFPKVSPSWLLRKFKRTLEAIGLNSRLYCLHSTRHTTAMELYQRSGHNLELVRKVLGHASIATTQKYLHVGDDETREAMEVLNYS